MSLFYCMLLILLLYVGDQIGRLQRILDALSEFCVKWGLKVNMSKTKSMVYRNGGMLKKKKKIFISMVPN
jgi:hypothetical protein